MCYKSASSFILGTDYTDVTDKLVFTSTKNRVNPRNPCLRKDKSGYSSFYQYASVSFNSSIVNERLSIWRQKYTMYAKTKGITNDTIAMV